MSKDKKARALALTAILSMAAYLVTRTGRHESNPTVNAADPEAAIYGMIDAARNGSVQRYLGEFTGQMEASLRQSLAESTELAFSSYLRDSNAELKGVAVSDPQKISETEAKVRVEYVFQDRNEAQTMYLEKGAKGWKIARTENDERIKTLIRYGTPVK